MVEAVFHTTCICLAIESTISWWFVKHIIGCNNNNNNYSFVSHFFSVMGLVKVFIVAYKTVEFNGMSLLR